MANHVVAEEGNGQRLDVYLAQIDPTFSRAQLKIHIEQGRVRVDDSIVTKAGYKLTAGQHITHDAPPLSSPEAKPEAIPLDIRYEDPWVIVINKDPGMVVHPAAGNRDGTLVNALLHHCPDLEGIGGVQRPGIVHRIDKDTSGLLVVAKTDVAHQGLIRQFKTRSLLRRYIAIVLGIRLAPQGEFVTLHGRHPHDRRRFTTRVSQGKPAVTHYEVLAESSLCTMVEVSLKTGRTHQIRVHFAEIGKPIVADTLYGTPPVNATVGAAGTEAAAIRKMARQALHAGVLGFTHPVTGQELLFVADLPQDMADLSRCLFGETGVNKVNNALNKWLIAEKT